MMDALGASTTDTKESSVYAAVMLLDTYELIAARGADTADV